MISDDTMGPLDEPIRVIVGVPVTALLKVTVTV